MPRAQHAGIGETSMKYVSASPPLMLRRPQAAAACGKGTSTWDKMTAAGLTPAPVKLLGTVLWNAEELAAWCRHGCPPRDEWKQLWPVIRDGRRVK